MNMYGVLENGKITKFFNKKEADELKRSGEDIFVASYDIADAVWSEWKTYVPKVVKGGHKPLLSYEQYCEARKLRDIENQPIQSLAERFDVSYSFMRRLMEGRIESYQKYERKFMEEII